jgi:hypothetical protein
VPPSPVKKAVAKKSVAPLKKAADAAPAIMARTPGAAPAKPRNIVPVGTGTSDYPRILIYGEPGSYKTITIGTAPNELILEADRGDISAARTGSTAEKWQIDDWEDAAEAQSWLMSGGYKHYEWLALDTISMFQDSGLFGIMDDLVIEKSHRKVWQPDKGEYGQNMSRLNRYMRDLVRLPIPIVVTAHMMWETDQDGEYKFMPAVQGKNMSPKICAYFDIVGHMEVRVVNGVETPGLSTHKDGKFYTKDRYGAIGLMVQPTIPKILAAMQGKPQGATAKKTVAKKVAPVKKAAAS